MFSKDHIISEIRRTAQENGGRPLGRHRFEAETGIKQSDYVGKFWARHSDAVAEAGFPPNVLTRRLDDDHVLEHLAKYARELRKLPVASEFKLKARRTPEFPSHTTFGRFGGKAKLASRLRDFAASRGYDDVVELCDAAVARSGKTESDPPARVAESNIEIGYVYLLKSERFYKIGRSNAVGRRERELAIQLPTEARVVHSIKTDDPLGIERYWHARFADRRKNGEWFALTVEDVAAFKRRRFM